MRSVVRILASVLLLVNLANGCKKVVAGNDCPGNQVRLACKTPCETTCDDYQTISCIETCQMNACGCPEGTVLKEEGNTECIPTDQCPRRECPGNQIRLNCKSPFDANCDNYENLVCIESYKPDACGCPEGTVVRDEGSTECISKEQCPKKDCPGNQVRLHCKIKCDPTCENYKDIFCYEICQLDACGCPDGTVLKEEGSTECIPIEQCAI